MPTIIETPGAADANSYVSVAFARQFASDIGLTLPADDTAVGQTLLAAMAYIEGQPYAGRRATLTQALEWPRAGVVGFADGVIPVTLKKAQVMAAYSVQQGIDLSAGQSTQEIKREKVGPIETEYYEGSGVVVSQFTAIDVYLAPLLVKSGGYRLTSSIGF